MSAALATATDDEARRIARELHDDVTQGLAVLSMDVGKAASEHLSDSLLRERLRDFQSKILEISEGIRQLSHRLHPSILDDLGLQDALGYLCGEFEKQQGIPVWFESDPLPEDLRPQIASCLYRIAQECLHNIAKHARALDVTVRLALQADVLELSIADSGVGLDSARATTGLGLHSIKERARLVNATVTIDSAPGAGTTVVVRVPLQRGSQ